VLITVFAFYFALLVLMGGERSCELLLFVCILCATITNISIEAKENIGK
jgi:hypothetical protein